MNKTITQQPRIPKNPAYQYCICQNEGWTRRNDVVICRNCLKPINPNLLPVDEVDSVTSAEQFLDCPDKDYELIEALYGEFHAECGDR